MSSFTDQINAFLVKAENQADDIVSTAVLDLQHQLSDATPVDTGKAKSNWLVEIDQCSGKTVTDTSNKNLAEAKELLSSARQSRRRPKYYSLFNNLEYIRVLEYGLYPNPPKKVTGKTVNGYSTQAPQGFFRLTVAGWQQTLQQAAKAKR